MKPDDRKRDLWEAPNPRPATLDGEPPLAERLREYNDQEADKLRLRQRVTVAAWIVVIAMLLATVWYVMQPVARPAYSPEAITTCEYRTMFPVWRGNPSPRIPPYTIVRICTVI